MRQIEFFIERKLALSDSGEVTDTEIARALETHGLTRHNQWQAKQVLGSRRSIMVAVTIRPAGPAAPRQAAGRVSPASPSGVGGRLVQILHGPDEGICGGVEAAEPLVALG
jgi:hypothetical protein